RKILIACRNGSDRLFALPGVLWEWNCRKYMEENGKLGGNRRTMTSTSRIARNVPLAGAEL
ncbi:MAG: hypothetical protein K2H09_08715, partial [Treponemataceae bacterium]|nr:hypothetical protein [Treponemataceae bacterium]